MLATMAVRTPSCGKRADASLAVEALPRDAPRDRSRPCPEGHSPGVEPEVAGVDPRASGPGRGRAAGPAAIPARVLHARTSAPRPGPSSYLDAGRARKLVTCPRSR